MQRREFAKKTLTAIAATSILGTAAKAQSQNKSPDNASDEEILNQSSPFKCKFAANYYGGLCFNAMKNCKTFEDKIQYYYDHGIRAIEDNNMLSRPVEVQEAIAKKMSQLGMEMGVFSSYGGMKFQMTANKLDPKKSPDKAASIEVTKQKMKDAVECAKRVNAKWITLVPGYIDPSFETSYQMANVAESIQLLLKRFKVRAVDSHSMKPNQGRLLLVFIECWKVKSFHVEVIHSKEEMQGFYGKCSKSAEFPL